MSRAALESAPECLTSRDWLAARTQGSMPSGAVLFHAPAQVFQAPGGGENQLVQTGRQLDALGVVVRPFSSWVDRLEEARLLHLFGMSREGLELARVANARGVPVVISTICWYDPRALRALADGRFAAARDFAKWAIRRAWPGCPSWRRELLSRCDLLLPNSHAEARQLVALFAADPARIRPVPNGVDPRFAEADPRGFHERFGPEEFVLYVGRIEPRKNVLGLALAARSLRLPLVAIGEAPPGRERYQRACRAAGGPSCRWLGAIAHDDPLLASAYAACRVVALPSWFETPGLAALEGALAGRAVVVTPFGSAPEYFADMVEYAAPGPKVASALVRAWQAGPDPRLAGHVAARFSWKEVARQTAEAYDEIAR
jgi:hypothetical protein